MKLTDPYLIITSIIYVLALTGLCFTPSPLSSALMLGLGVALLSVIVVFITRKQITGPLDIVRPRAELGAMLIWYGLVFILAIATNARGIELVNEFTNWFFLVVTPVILLVIVRRRGIAMRAILHSAGFRPEGLKIALKLAGLIGLLLIPVLYLVGQQQRAAIQMVFREPQRAAIAFSISFILALMTSGFVEEFFFRGVLQTRLTVCIGSEWCGLLVASLLFGLFHLPMYLFSPFEPTHGDLLWAVTSVITEQAVLGVMLGVLWARTHNLAAPMLVHAFINAIAMMSTLKIGIGG